MFLRFFGKKERGASAAGGARAVDPEMFYCNTCGGEFRHHLDACPSCGVALESGAVRLERLRQEQQRRNARPASLPPGSATVNLRRGPLRDMKELQRVLAEEGVPSILGGEEGECGRGCCGPELYLKIRPEDADLALEILARDFVRHTAVDSNELSRAAAVFDPRLAQVVCPACGCRFSPTVGACPDCGLSFE